MKIPVSAVYRLADELAAASRAVDNAPAYGVRPELDALLDKPVYPGDLDNLAKEVLAIADAWQAEVDASEITPPPGFEQWGRT